jgi:hypothetical protein
MASYVLAIKQNDQASESKLKQMSMFREELVVCTSVPLMVLLDADAIESSRGKSAKIRVAQAQAVLVISCNLNCGRILIADEESEVRTGMSNKARLAKDHAVFDSS